MKKYIFILLLSVISITTFSQTKRDSISYKRDTTLTDTQTSYIRDTTLTDAQIILRDMKEIKKHIDTTLQTGNQCVKLLKEEVGLIGVKKTIQANHQIFVPIVIFGILFLVWLKGKGK